MRPRWTLRARLTVVYAAVFLLGAAVLLAVTVTLVDRSLVAAYKSGAEAARRSLDVVPTPTPTASGKAGAADAAAFKRKLLEANAQTNRDVEADTVDRLVTTSLVSLAVLVPLTALAGWVLAGRALRPVARITESARRASETRLSERLALGGPRDEITELGDTFDAMLDRLEHAFDAQRRFTADASHELRTPLTVARTTIEVVLAKPNRTPEQLTEMAHDVHAALRRAESLVDGLLTLTRSQHLEHRRDEVDLAIVVEDALDARAGQILSRDLSVRRALAPAPAIGDRTLLDHLAVNLVDNAVRHNQPGGRIDVGTGRDGRGSYLIVSNTGPVLDPGVLSRLFDPFQRADGRARSDRSGLGLGLSIVRSVAVAHGARVDTTANPGGGLTIRITLPPRPTAYALR
jgi:signal transduction histidine kinase